MKLSQLVRFLNTLDQLPRPDAAVICQKELGNLLHTVNEGATQFPSMRPARIADVQNTYELAQQTIDRFNKNIDHIRAEIQQMIESIQPQYFADSYRLHDEAMVDDPDQHIFDRKPVLATDVQQYLSSRMAVHSDWHHAALVIRPGLGEWLPFMVAADPLYLVDIRSSLLEPSMEQFTPAYRRRLRPYILKENDAQGHVLKDIPDGQLGFCVAVNFFHYKPFEIIRLYLSDIYRKLKPGGVLAFTFNDCDLWGGVELAERCYMCYTPGGMVRTLCETIGYEISLQYQIDNCNTWLEMRRPGILTSLRGGQSLAKIWNKVSTAVEIPPQRVYTAEEIKVLQQEAIDLNIDTPSMVREGYTPADLEKLIMKRKNNA